MTDYTELKRLAEAAPSGPWIAENDSLYFKDDGYTRHLLDADAGHDVEDEAYYAALKFIATANPSAVLALIAESERLINNRDMWRGQCDRQSEMLRLAHEVETQLKAEIAGLKTGYQAYEQVNAELKAEVDSLTREADRQYTTIEAYRKDADRYRWLRDNSESVHQFYLSTPIWFTGVKFSKENVDSTIDAAMGKGGQP